MGIVASIALLIDKTTVGAAEPTLMFCVRARFIEGSKLQVDAPTFTLLVRFRL